MRVLLTSAGLETEGMRRLSIKRVQFPIDNIFSLWYNG